MMSLRRIGYLVFGLLVLLSVIQTFYYYPQLPDRVATHFDLKGQANGWAGKSSQLYFSLGLTLFLSLVFFGLNWIMPKFPDSMVNLPHKEYWLAPERRDQSYRTLTHYMIWFGAATMLLLIVIQQLSIQVNLGRIDSVNPGGWYVLGFYIAFTAVWTVMMFKQFYNVPV